MRPDISPLILAKTALKASEDAERDGDIDEAIKHAREAVYQSAVWSMSLRGIPVKDVYSRKAAKQAQAWAESIRGTQKVGEQAAPPSPKGEIP